MSHTCIEIAKNSGFCFGVKNATDSIEREISLSKSKKNGARIFTLGHLIHNDTYNKFLESQGVVSIGAEDIECIARSAAKESPVRLFIRAHGIPKQIDEKLAELMLARHREARPFTFYHYMIDLTGGPCIYKRISGCGSGTEYMAVTPWGDLYPCHQFVGEEKFKLGNVFDGVSNFEAQEDFAACNVYSRPECRECWARLYCSGGCAANAYHSTGSVRGVYKYGCELFKKRMECAIMLEVAKTLEAEEN